MTMRTMKRRRMTMIKINTLFKPLGMGTHDSRTAVLTTT